MEIIIIWIGEHENFLMPVLTAIYAGVTIAILALDKKSMKAATAANKRQLAWKLLDHRLEVYYTFKKWMFIAESLLQNYPDIPPINVFNTILYKSSQDEKIEAINQQLDDLEDKLNNNELPGEQRELIESTHDLLITKRIIKKVAMLDAEEGIINQIEIFFPKIKFEIIPVFTSLFMKVVIKSQPEDIEKLKEIVQEIIDERMVETLWNTIKTNNLKIIGDSVSQLSYSHYFLRFIKLIIT